MLKHRWVVATEPAHPPMCLRCGAAWNWENNTNNDECTAAPLPDEVASPTTDHAHGRPTEHVLLDATQNGRDVPLTPSALPSHPTTTQLAEARQTLVLDAMSALAEGSFKLSVELAKLSVRMEALLALMDDGAQPPLPEPATHDQPITPTPGDDDHTNGARP